MKHTTIYALADPLTHEVLYVGQCANMKWRYLTHLSAMRTTKEPLYVRLRTRLPAMPVLVILEKLESRKIHHPKASSTSQFHFLSTVSVAEAKWLKRFRRTVLNRNKKQCCAYDDFINTPELRARYGLE
jgi:hypothetical protein